MLAKARVAILISGTGTNMAALLFAAQMPDCPYEVALVACNNPDAQGLKLAAAEGVPTYALSHVGMDRMNHDAAIHDAIIASGANFVALAGYMRILSPWFVQKWSGRMLNIHPSLLPLYPGLDTHARAIAAGDSHAGCSVHLVTEDLDAGPVLGQMRVAILPDDSADTLAARVKMAEHQLYPRAMAQYLARSTDPAWLTAQVRALAMAQPEAEESLSHGMACFGIIGGKKFAYVTANHHGANNTTGGKVALLVKISGIDEQIMLIDRDPDRYFRPAYFGDGWAGIRLDLGNTDWDDISAWIGKSWRAVAPRKLTRILDIADQF